MSKAYQKLPLELSQRAPIDYALESDYQVTFFDILRLNKRQHLIFDDVYHVPNGGHRHKSVALQMVAEGAKQGIHDLSLDVARRGFHGWRVELKVRRNVLSEHQVNVRKRLIEENYFAHTAWHYAEAFAMLLWYLEIPSSKVQGLPNKHCIQLPKQGGHDARCGCSDFRIENIKWW